jgi:uncharacterized protein GlcG (DUF336 family)
MIKTLGITSLLLLCLSVDIFAANCKDLPTEPALRSALTAAPTCNTACGASAAEAGGLFHGTRMWVAVVNRDGELCGTVASMSDPTQVWPGSQAIAKAKAYTANAFSLDVLALSSANLYTFTQPGHSLWSLGQSNLWNPRFTVPPDGHGGEGRNQQIAGGLIFFGGGVPLYKNGKIIGGLGISGDTSCTDHEIAKRTRHLLSLDPTGGPTADDIHYTATNGADNFTHPLCINTWKNGVFVGNEAPATGY